MSKIRHKIAAALALFGVLVPVALAQTVGGTANIEIVERGPSITTVRNLLLGQFFRPRTGDADADAVVTCLPGGVISTFNSEAILGAGPRQCGQVDITVGGTAGDPDRSLGLAFAGTAATDLQDGSGGVIETEYSLLNASGDEVDFIIADGTSTTTSLNFDFPRGAVTSLYIGVRATLTSTTPAGDYTGRYEIVLTVP